MAALKQIVINHYCCEAAGCETEIANTQQFCDKHCAHKQYQYYQTVNNDKTVKRLECRECGLTEDLIVLNKDDSEIVKRNATM